MLNDIEKVLISKEQLEQMVTKMGEQISKDYEGKNLLVISVLKGAAVFMSDIIRQISIPCQIDFMAASSYGKGTSTTGSVKILKDLDIDVTGFDILIVEDILDSGVTLSNIIKLLESRKARSVKVCTLLSKPARRQVEIPVAYEGFVVPDEFVVGYGLDFAEKYRNLPFIGVLKEEIYS